MFVTTLSAIEAIGSGSSVGRFKACANPATTHRSRPKNAAAITRQWAPTVFRSIRDIRSMLGDGFCRYATILNAFLKSSSIATFIGG